MRSSAASRVARLSIGITLVVLGGCEALGPRQSGTARAPTEAERLGDLLHGSFSSRAQAETDPDNYYDIRLHMTPIWTERRDGPWLYVEQSAAFSLGQPYRQRIYHLVRMLDGSIECQVYQLPGDPQRFAGAWREPALLGDVVPEQLQLLSGCSVIFRPQPDGTFAGKTAGTGCESVLRGARYATSEVTISQTELRTLDRGFNERNEQVWGATSGPYIFRRVSPEEASRAPASQPSRDVTEERKEAAVESKDAGEPLDAESGG